MDWNLVLYAGLGGGLGGFIGSYLSSLFNRDAATETIERSDEQKPKGKKSLLAIILVIAGINILPALYKASILPEIIPLNTSDLHKEIPTLAVIEKTDPESYERLMAPLKSAARRGRSTDEELTAFREVYYGLIAEKSLTGQADTLQNIYDVSIEQYAVLKTKAPKICTLKMHGRPFPSLEPYLDDDYLALEQEALLKLFEESPRSLETMPDVERGQELFTAFIVKTFEELSIPSIDPEDSPGVDNLEEHEKVCEFNIAMAEYLVSLSDEDFYNVDAFLNLPE